MTAHESAGWELVRPQPSPLKQQFSLSLATLDLLIYSLSQHQLSHPGFLSLPALLSGNTSKIMATKTTELYSRVLKYFHYEYNISSNPVVLFLKLKHTYQDHLETSIYNLFPCTKSSRPK